MSISVLREFTKDEIIEWIGQRYLVQKVARSDLMLIRWDRESTKLQREYQAELDRWEAKKPDFAVRDRLARQFNESRCNDERLRLLHEMQPYHKALEDHMARCRALDRKQKKLDLLYDRISRERDQPPAGREVVDG